MKKILAVSVCFLLFILTGCREMPDEVAKQAETYHIEREVTEKEKTREYLGRKELSADAEQALSKEYENLYFPEKMSAEYALPEKILSVEMKIAENFTDRFEEVGADFAKFAGEELWNQKKDKAEVRDYGIKNEEMDICFEDLAKGIDDEESKYHFEVGENGFVCQIVPMARELAFEMQKKCLENNYPLYEPASEVEYRLVDGVYTVRQAVEDVEEWMNTVWKKYEPDFDYRVNAVSVYQADEETCFFSIDVVKFYKGILISDVDWPRDEGEMTDKYIYSSFWIQMHRQGSIDVFSNLGAILTVDEKTERELSESYALSAALQKIEQEFASFHGLKIQDVDVRYVLKPLYDYHTNNAKSAGVKIDARPVWGLPLADRERSVREANYQMAHMVFVDMQTGNLEYNLQ